jgi:pyruvate/2-oxoglutarate dehydrogenase complex dihydrolipoamide acyltransferase (E2) component
MAPKMLRSITHSRICQVKVVEQVPALGESITEGTISEWVKSVGEYVNVDEAVVIVETDKVTVDIKATQAGTLVQQFQVDGDVSVGQDLYEIDTDGGPSAGSSPPPHNTAGEASSASTTTNATPVASGDHSHDHRQPLIKFLGKRSLLQHPLSHSSVSSGTQPTSSTPSISTPQKVVKEGNGIDFRTLKGGAMYGRPEITDAEIEAIESGGANGF